MPDFAFISPWFRPDDRDLGMEDYRTLGVMSALDVVNAIVPDQKVHAAGYCLGGTLLSITAAATATIGWQALLCSPLRPTSPKPARSCCSSMRARLPSSSAQCGGFGDRPVVQGYPVARAGGGARLARA